MSTNVPYQVSARKYRPKTFAELIGQEVLVKTIDGAIQSGRIPHAFILTGVRGVGKTTTARLLARGLNCVGADGTGTETITPCGACPQCEQIAQDAHLDVIEIDAASRTGVDDMRELIDSVAYKPVSARYKIYIIDEVHMLSKSAFNALLKTLEEPPQHVKFFFATTEIHKVPVTILSRCQRFDLRRVTHETLTVFLKGILSNEGKEADPEALSLIADASEGSVRDALSLLDQAINLSGKTILTATVEGMLGRVSDQSLLDLLTLLFKGQTENALQKAAALYAQGGDPLAIADNLLHLVHRVSLQKVAASVAGEGPAIEGALQKMAADLTVPVLSRAWQLLFRGRQEIQEAGDSYPVLQMLFIRFCYIKDVPPLGQLIESLSSAVSSEPLPAPVVQEVVQPVSAAAPVEAHVELVKIPVAISDNAPALAPDKTENKKTGPQTFEDMILLCDQNKEALLAANLRQNVVLVHYAPCTLHFGFRGDPPETFVGNLRKCLQTWTGESWELEFREAVTGETLEEQSKRASQEKMNKAVQSDNVQKLLQTFPEANVQSIETGKETSE